MVLLTYLLFHLIYVLRYTQVYCKSPNNKQQILLICIIITNPLSSKHILIWSLLLPMPYVFGTRYNVNDAYRYYIQIRKSSLNKRRIKLKFFFHCFDVSDFIPYQFIFVSLYIVNVNIRYPQENKCNSIGASNYLHTKKNINVTFHVHYVYDNDIPK